MRLKDLFLLQQHLSSSSRREQVLALQRVLARPNFLRIAIEQRWITEGQAYFFALAHHLYTDLLTDLSPRTQSEAEPLRDP
jgi:hypothetical protein